MRNTQLRFLTLLALPFLAIACSDRVEQPDRADAVETDVVDTAPVETPAETVWGAAQILSATPGAAACDPGSIIHFNWNVPDVPDTTSVELWVGDGDASKLFAAGGPRDEVSTGPWATSGTIFVLRDPADQSELDRIVIDGPECVPPAEAGSEAGSDAGADADVDVDVDADADDAVDADQPEA